MKIQDLQNKLVAVLGFGLEGRAVAQYLIKHGISPVLFDQKPWDQWDKKQQKYIKSLKLNFIFGPDCFKELGGFDIAFRSPGIKILNADIRTNIKKGLKVTSQTKWFFENCPGKIIGVTGTKGKGTTASLIFQILKKQYPVSSIQYPNIYLTGNIGKQQPSEFLDDLTKNDWVVYELSSFQLQDLERSPHIAVVLKTFLEHLDYHKDAREYFEAKTNITKHQTPEDYAVVNADDFFAKKIGERGQGKKVYFSTKQKLTSGCFTQDNLIAIKDILGKNFQYPISNIQLLGRHNLENVCAASAAAVLAGADQNSVISAIKNFKNLPHRLEFAGEKNGIKFYDDSISTTPETTIAAINSFAENLILILGGSSKNSDFNTLCSELTKKPNIKGLILIGQEAPKILASLEKTGNFRGKILTEAKNMREVFGQIKVLAKLGSIVLLSPACASFGMFKNYQDRGDQFKLEIQKW